MKLEVCDDLPEAKEKLSFDSLVPLGVEQGYWYHFSQFLDLGCGRVVFVLPMNEDQNIESLKKTIEQWLNTNTYLKACLLKENEHYFWGSSNDHSCVLEVITELKMKDFAVAVSDNHENLLQTIMTYFDGKYIHRAVVPVCCDLAFENKHFLLLFHPLFLDTQSQINCVDRFLQAFRDEQGYFNLSKEKLCNSCAMLPVLKDIETGYDCLSFVPNSQCIRALEAWMDRLLDYSFFYDGVLKNNHTVTVKLDAQLYEQLALLKEQNPLWGDLVFLYALSVTWNITDRCRVLVPIRLRALIGKNREYAKLNGSLPLELPIDSGADIMKVLCAIMSRLFELYLIAAKPCSNLISIEEDFFSREVYSPCNVCLSCFSEDYTESLPAGVLRVDKSCINEYACTSMLMLNIDHNNCSVEFQSYTDAVKLKALSKNWLMQFRKVLQYIRSCSGVYEVIFSDFLECFKSLQKKMPGQSFLTEAIDESHRMALSGVQKDYYWKSLKSVRAVQKNTVLTSFCLRFYEISPDMLSQALMILHERIKWLNVTVSSDGNVCNLDSFKLCFEKKSFFKIKNLSSVLLTGSSKSPTGSLSYFLSQYEFDIDRSLIDYYLVEWSQGYLGLIFVIHPMLMDSVSSVRYIFLFLRTLSAVIEGNVENFYLPTVGIADASLDHADDEANLLYWKVRMAVVGKYDFIGKKVGSDIKFYDICASERGSVLRLSESLTNSVKVFCLAHRVSPKFFFQAVYCAVLPYFFSGMGDLQINTLWHSQLSEGLSFFGKNSVWGVSIIPQQQCIAPEWDLFKLISHLQQEYNISIGKRISLRARECFYQNKCYNFFYGFLDLSEFASQNLFDQSLGMDVKFCFENALFLNVTWRSRLAILKLDTDLNEFHRVSLLKRMECCIEQFLGGIARLSVIDWLLPIEKLGLETVWGIGPVRLINYPDFAILFQCQIKLFSDKRLTLGEGFMSYHELDQKSDDVIQVLLELGVRSGDAVVLWFWNIEQLVLMLYSVLKMGVTYSVVDCRRSLTQVSKLFVLTQSCWVFTDRILLNRVENFLQLSFLQAYDNSLIYMRQVACTSDFDGKNFPLTYGYSMTNGVNEDTIPYFQSVFMSSLVWYMRTISLGPDDVVLVTHDCEDCWVQKNIIAAAMKGSKIVLHDQPMKNLGDLLQAIDRFKVSFLTLPQSLFCRLLKFEKVVRGQYRCLNSLRVVVLIRDTVEENPIQSWFLSSPTHADVLMHFGYGRCLESLSYYWYSVLESEPIEGYRIGKPVDNVLMKVVNTAGIVLAPYIEGELIVKHCEGDSKFIKTGDYAYYNYKGEFFVSGRKDSCQYYRGYLLNVDTIKSMIMEYAGVRAAHCFFGEAGFCVELKVNVTGEPNKYLMHLRQYLTWRLPWYCLPNRIKITEFSTCKNYVDRSLCT